MLAAYGSMEAVMSRCGNIMLALALLLTAPVVALAQAANNPSTQGNEPQPASQAAPNPAAAATTDQLLKPEQLEALVAPIALYPDDLLANVLAASTYPLEVVQADRWVTGNKALKDDALKKEVEKQSWDESVKALVSVTAVLSMMSEKIDWTKNLGDAVLAQQPDVMDAIQRLRAKAQANNKLPTTKQQKVSVKTQDKKQVIAIESAEPDKIYVPYYNPATVYGAWPYEEYPPYYFAAPPYIGTGVVAAGLAFGVGWAIGRWGNYWGGGCNWGNNNFYVNHFNKINNVGNAWQHRPEHRQGVRYNNANVAQRFGNSNLKAGAANRMDFRGRDGQQVLRQAQDRPGSGDRAGDRVGDRGGDRAAKSGKGDRPTTADRAKGGSDRAKGASNRSKAGGDRAKAGRDAARGGGNRGGRDTAFKNVSSGRAANLQSARGRASIGARPGGAAAFAGRGGGGFQRASFHGGGGFRGGGGGGFRGGGGGRRSDIALKRDIVLLGYLQNGLGYYRFRYLDSGNAYVGVMAQEVLAVVPDAVIRGRDGYLRVYYDKIGVRFSTYRDWLATGAKIPTTLEAFR